MLQKRCRAIHVNLQIMVTICSKIRVICHPTVVATMFDNGLCPINNVTRESPAQCTCR